MHDISLKNESLKIPKDYVLCREGDTDTDLYLVMSGKLLICSRSGRMVTPIAHLSKDEYFGEMSFFDGRSRSADVIALEETTLIKVSSQDLKVQMPTWLLVLAKQMTNKLREIDSVIRDKGIKRKKAKSMKPLSIEEQRHYFQLLTK